MTYTYKTNINCGGCVAKVKPFLDGEPRISRWAVDYDDPSKILTVETEAMRSDEVMDVVRAAGYQIEEKKKSLFSKLF